LLFALPPAGAVASVPPLSDTRTSAPLTTPELQVLRGVAEGLSAKETAQRLVKSEHTVIAQRRAIQAKLGARNLPHAVALAFARHLLPLPGGPREP
jgi:DNA-binding CsgD family transcriptional regulator